MKVFSLKEVEHTQGTLQFLSDDPHVQRKKGTSIVLIPQPNTHDPRDPLNWPYAKRVAAICAALFFCSLTHFTIAGIAPGFGQLAVEFNVGPSKLTWLITACVAGECGGCFTLAPLIDRVGRRPVWLGCSIWYFVCNIWAAKAQSYSSLLVARFLASWTAGCSEPISVSAINDLFFLHERGTINGVQGIWLALGAALAPVISGFLIAAKGWRWYQWLAAILGGFDLLLLFFLYPETQYRRDLHRAMDITGVAEEDEGSEPVVVNGPEKQGDLSNVSHQEEIFFSNCPKRDMSDIKKPSYWQGLRPWSPIQHDISVLGSYARPWLTLSYPIVVWAIFPFTICVTCFLVLITLIPIYLGGPEYNFSIQQQGLVYIAPCIGAVCGAFLCGYLNDKTSHWSTRRNGGVFEPEMRLPVMIFPTILEPMGILMFAYGVHLNSHWIVPVFGAGLVGIGLTGIPAILNPYLTDTYAPVMSDILVILYGFKNILSFGIGFGVVPWLELDGVIAVFWILAAMIIVMNTFAVVVWKWGKTLRKLDGPKRVLIY